MENNWHDIAYLKVLRKINAQLNNTSLNWAVTGSLGFALQGVPVEPNDIDIQTDEKGAYKIERHFSEFMKKAYAKMLAIFNSYDIIQEVLNEF